MDGRQLEMVDVGRVLPNPEQPRRSFDKEELQGLAQSIRELGVLEPILLERADNGYYLLHDGERRLRAAKIAGLMTIPAVVQEALNGSGQRDRLVRALVANVQRADLSPVEEAEAYERMRAQGMSTADISRLTGKTETVVYSRLELLRLEPEIRELVHRKRLPGDPRVTRALLRLEPGTRVHLAKRAAERGLTIAGIEQAVKTLVKRIDDWQAEGTPAIDVAIRKHGEVDAPRWDAIAQCGAVPPWKLVERAARETCSRCVLAVNASAEICGQCPAPAILGKMIEMVKARLI